jgi:hypothetical protein
MAVISPNYPGISTDLREAHSHHVSFLVNLKHIPKRSLLFGEIFNKSSTIRKLV